MLEFAPAACQNRFSSNRFLPTLVIASAGVESRGHVRRHPHPVTDRIWRSVGGRTLLPLVCEELRKLAAARMAAESPGHTLQATALVHEAYLRLVGGDKAQRWNSRGHFFGAAAEAMRRILVENARRKARVKHGGDRQRARLDIV